MGNTNPKEAEAGTIRADFAESIDANAVHGSDSPVECAKRNSIFLRKHRDFWLKNWINSLFKEKLRKKFG